MLVHEADAGAVMVEVKWCTVGVPESGAELAETVGRQMETGTGIW